MTVRTLLERALAALWLSGCTVLFPFSEPSPPPPPEDAGPHDAALDAPSDAALDAFDPGPCPERPIELRTHDDCLGCGLPCGPRRPFCCGYVCCTDECGAPDNTCSIEPEEIPPLLDAGPPIDAGWRLDPDAGCDLTDPLNCLGCGVACHPGRPFCCAGGCCSEECGSLPNDCSLE